MTNSSKRYKESVKYADATKTYTLKEAISVLRKMLRTTYEEYYEEHLRPELRPVFDAGITTGRPACITARQLFVVPKSMPSIFAIKYFI